jgi:hypothetical protein
MNFSGFSVRGRTKYSVMQSLKTECLFTDNKVQTLFSDVAVLRPPFINRKDRHICNISLQNLVGLAVEGLFQYIEILYAAPLPHMLPCT